MRPSWLAVYRTRTLRTSAERRRFVFSPRRDSICYSIISPSRRSSRGQEHLQAGSSVSVLNRPFPSGAFHQHHARSPAGLGKAHRRPTDNWRASSPPTRAPGPSEARLLTLWTPPKLAEGIFSVGCRLGWVVLVLEAYSFQKPLNTGTSKTENALCTEFANDYRHGAVTGMPLAWR